VTVIRIHLILLSSYISVFAIEFYGATVNVEVALSGVQEIKRYAED